MRPKFIFAFLGMTSLALGLIFFPKNQVSRSEPLPQSETVRLTSTAQISNQMVSSADAGEATTPEIIGTPANDAQSIQEADETTIDSRVLQLKQWATEDDREALINILANLSDSEKEIRLAAIEAAKNFGSRDAIPSLQSLAATTDDTEEKNASIAAAEFLALPTINEAIAQTPPGPKVVSSPGSIP